MQRTAVVAGATGLVGNELVKLLLWNKSYRKVIVLVRKRMNLTHPRLEQLVLDFDRLCELPPGLLGGADVYCTLGTTRKKAGSKERFEHVDYDYPIMLGKVAKRDGANRMLIITAMGANEKSLFFYSRVKGKVESDLQAMCPSKLHIFRPSLIIGERRERRFGEAVAARLAKSCAFLFMGGLRKYKPIAAKRIAQAMIAAALYEEGAPKILSSPDIASWGAILQKSSS
ncbi:NAD(P)H-binding protein [Paenibacillus sp. HB172176]|uniref:NAD(P)H-binding protein n=1 Tax=Paenibacillus sp. HB172176 TaxID=2493690 RepID=UPI00143C379C|nr:NAD(P)H-binding protein [Paenibacillus sp. HB172176]